MSSLARASFIIAVLISATMCIACAASWVRRYRTYDRLAWRRVSFHGGDRTLNAAQVLAVRGHLLFNRTTDLHEDAFGWISLRERAITESMSPWVWKSQPTWIAPRWSLSPQSLFNQIGFGFAVTDLTRNQYYTLNPGLRFGPDAVWRMGRHSATAILPHWFICAITAIAPAVGVQRLMRWLRSRWRRSRGLCAGCAYDLRASAGRCPECGLSISSAAQ